MSDHVWLEKVAALRAGRIPDDVDPGSLDGRRFALLARNVKDDLDAAPPMTPAQKRIVVTLLRGGVSDVRSA